MRTLATILLGAVLSFSLSALATEIGPGPVYGHWYSSGNPYNVNGDIDVPADSTLYIHEGVVVVFQGFYELTVQGWLEAVGTEADSIHFFPADTTTRWKGIYFFNAQDSSHLSYCTIRYGYWHSGIYAGALHLYYSNPVVTHCTISDNVGFSGGAVYMTFGSSPTISHCTFNRNSSRYDGGAIYIHHLGGNSPVFSHCLIRDNTGEYGGGLYSFSGSATLSHCVFSGNLGLWGGGIYSNAPDTLTVSYSTFTGNIGEGAGICVGANKHMDIDHCTMDGNNAITQGSAVLATAIGASATLTNTCVTNNNATALSGSVSVSYSDFYGNTNNGSGTGPLVQVNANGDSCDANFNIYLDPAYVGVYNQDYNLRWGSPCVDAGDPNSPLDPDNTVCDMGRFYFNQDVDQVIELYPHDEPIVIPAQGGQLVYDGWVFNFIGYPGRADIWTYAFVPGIGRYGPIDLYRNAPIPADSIGRNNIRQNVPGLAPQGAYTFVAYVGSYPSTIIDSSYFYFSKEASVAGEIGDWCSSGWLMKAGDETAFNLPGHYGLSQNYPNPFNTATAIHYQLPADTDVKLEVYNLFGQRVAKLVDEEQQAGYRSVTWDASKVSSGIYFYRLTAGDFTETKRMMLVK